MSHEKKHLPRGLELEKRRYIGFARQPVVEDKAHYPTGVTPPEKPAMPYWRRPEIEA